MSKAQENAAFPGYTMDMDTKRVSFQEGMALRDYFAAKAMPAILVWDTDHTNWDSYAKMAYEMADAMLKERNT